MNIFKSKTACVLLLCAGAVSTPGCSIIQPQQVDCGLSHASHPLLGAPFGPKTEEDSLNVLGCRMRTEMPGNERLFVETSLGRKMGDGGFYGDSKLVFQSYIGVKLWERNR